jgi:hypothetical protein
MYEYRNKTLKPTNDCYNTSAHKALNKRAENELPDLI